MRYTNQFGNIIEAIEVIGTHLLDMKEFIVKFPHLMIQILKKTNNEGLTKSKKVTRTWQKFIDEENYPWLRIVKIPTILQMDPTYGIPTYLHLAAEYGQNDVFEMILKSEADKDLINLLCNMAPSPFLVACHKGYVEIAKMFLRKSKELEIVIRKKNNANLLDYHISNPSDRLRSSSKSNKFEPSLIVETGFRFACEAGHIKIVEMMICKVVSLELNLAAKDVFGRTGFHLACHAGHTNIVEMLIDKSETVDFDLKTKDLGGCTGFQHAVISMNEGTFNLIKFKMPCLVIYSGPIYSYEAAGKTPSNLGIMDHPFKTSSNFTRFVGKIDQSLMDSPWDYVQL